MPLDILFLGGTSIDLIHDKSNRKKQYKSVGGGITNTAVIVSKLGLKVAMLSRIGKDPFGNFAVKRLDSYRVNTSGIIQDPNIRTPLAIANIDKYGNSQYTFYKNPPKDSIVPLERVPKGLLETCQDSRINGDTEHRLPNTTNISFQYIEGEAVLYHLSDLGICASSGSACTSGSLEPSHVIRAMGVPFTAAHGSTRFSFSRYNTDEDVDYLLENMPKIVERLRKLSPFV